MIKITGFWSEGISIAIVSFLAALFILTTVTANTHAQAQKDYGSAKETDPKEMGWMQGFPPPDSLLLSAADGSFFTFPKMRYSVCHMRQFLPTVNVSREFNARTPLT